MLNSYRMETHLEQETWPWWGYNAQGTFSLPCHGCLLTGGTSLSSQMGQNWKGFYPIDTPGTGALVKLEFVWC